MTLLALAYPELSAGNFERIGEYRRNYDPLYEVVKPHFTFVFPVTGFSITDFTTEIKKQLREINSISFCIRRSVIHKDEFHDRYHAFLLPDEGFDELVKLHDKLYSDRLSRHHRKDIAFIPHITIGTSINEKICRKIVDDWNAKGIPVNGVIATVDVVNYEEESVLSVEKIKLVGK